MRLAILADIHGNLPALEAVIADLQQQRPDAVYLAGDQINRCPWNNEVLELLDTFGWPAIQGNHEYVIGRINTPQNFAPFTNQARFPGLWWTQARLRPAYLTAIRELPAELSITWPNLPPIRLLHGIPGNSFVGLLPSASDDQLATLLATVPEEIVVCAHTHRPMLRTAGAWQIWNGGSVGSPYNGDPRAQYLLLDGVAGRWLPTLRQVDYDLRLVEQAFVASGMLAEVGPLAELDLRTVVTGEPWSSDFGHWMKFQPAPLQGDLQAALHHYFTLHGPGRWAFEATDQ